MPYKNPLDKKINRKKHYLLNKDKFKEYRKNNKEYYKQYYLKNKEKLNKQHKEYNLKNIKKYLSWHSNRRKKIEVRIIQSLRTRHWSFLKGYCKSDSTMNLLGVPNRNFYLKYLENKFKPGMTWENYGKVWHIDHIIPCSAFNPHNKEHHKILFHHTNHQPLFVHENLSKGSKIIKQDLTLNN